MKNLNIIILAIIITLPRSAFGIAGFGFKFIQDGTKLGASSYTEGSGLSAVTVNPSGYHWVSTIPPWVNHSSLS